MKKNMTLLLIGIVFAMSISGCAVALIGAGVAGGMAISSDTVKTDVDNKAADIWESAVYTVKKMGVVTTENKLKKTLEAIAEESNVTVWVEELTPKACRLKVKARKNLLPNINLAHKISVRIIESAK